MTKFKIYAGLKHPYTLLHLIDEKEFLTNREAKWCARERFIAIMNLMILLL